MTSVTLAAAEAAAAAASQLLKTEHRSLLKAALPTPSSYLQGTRSSAHERYGAMVPGIEASTFAGRAEHATRHTMAGSPFNPLVP